MDYVSTRGTAPRLGFDDVLLAGLARDGGLYVPTHWPTLSRETITAMASQPYEAIAETVMAPFMAGSILLRALPEILAESYAGFAHRAIAPLTQLAPGLFVAELFHGPTLAFKDIAMQVLARLMDRLLAARGQRVTIIGATSGDTGGAAIDAFAGREAIDIFILFPDGRVSDVQRRQMTTPTASNVHTIAVAGTFDDCQAQVKALFNDLALRDRLAFAGVNSINWARLLAQIPYYFSTATSLGAPDRAVSYAVPTGNFGDIFAGLAAKRMGLSVDRLMVATNVNDILARVMATGTYKPGEVVATSSPSMDIQVSSNFERLLYLAAARDGARVAELMADLKSHGALHLTPAERAAIAEDFSAARIDEPAVADEMRSTLYGARYLADPHTAIGIAAARQMLPGSAPVIALATAHPAKFPAAVQSAIGCPPSPPQRVAEQAHLPERFTRLPNEFSAIADFIATRTRASQPA